MRIKVISIFERNNIIVVECESSLGIFKGVWKSKTIRPCLNTSYSVEFTLADISYDEVEVSNAECVSVYSVDESVYFKGICDDYDGEIYYIRFADDWLQMLYIEEEKQHFNIADTISFCLKTEQVEIYAYDPF